MTVYSTPNHFYPYELVVYADKADEGQFWRIHRIHMVLGYAQALADLDNNEKYYKKIKTYIDRKGIPIVIWHSNPTEKEKRYLQTAVQSIVNSYDGEPIEHLIDGEEE